eukprot:16429517-Heterocapsa_arctica.AAC.1
MNGLDQSQASMQLDDEIEGIGPVEDPDFDPDAEYRKRRRVKDIGGLDVVEAHRHRRPPVAGETICRTMAE